MTIGASSYSIFYAHSIFDKISHLLGIFEGKKLKKLQSNEERKPFDVILFGYHRIGYKVMNALKDSKMSFIVVDYNPKVILSLRREGINCIYGDASEEYFISELGLEKAKLIISTIPDESSNLRIKEKLASLGSKAVFIATAEQPRSALDLYQNGADYVIVPHHLGGDYISEIIKKHCLDPQFYKQLGRKHFKNLKNARNKSNYN
jgi:hypothetical protein